MPPVGWPSMKAAMSWPKRPVELSCCRVKLARERVFAGLTARIGAELAIQAEVVAGPERMAARRSA